ncbi:hypothetical protein Tco_1501633 [Tanacetum coccineum]
MQDLDIVGDLLFIHLLLDLISFVIFLFKSKNLVKLFTVGSVHDIAHVLPIIWPVLFGLALELTAHGLSLVSLSFADILLLLHFLGHYQFKSKTLQDECSPEGRCRASMFALFVKEELDSWPEQSRRVRSWVTIPEAFECCRHSWMREALENGFNKWSDDGMIRTMKATNQVSSDASDGWGNMDREESQVLGVDVEARHTAHARVIMAPKKTTTPVTDAQLKVLIARGVANALAEDEANRTSRNGDDSHDSGTGSRRTERAARECNYSDFLKCQPLNFKGTEGVVGLTQWFEKIESVKGTDVESYSQCFQELALMCDRMFPEESDEIEKYVGGLPDVIHVSVMESKPKIMHDAIEFATELMDQKIRTLAERQAENKRKLDNNNQAQQQPPKKQGVAIAYTAGSGERKEFAGTLPLCNKCKFHHNGQCTVKCANCKRVGHLTRDCRSPAATNNQRNLTCYECGNQGHYRSDCPELKNQNHGNQAGGTGARGMVHALGGGETNQDLNNMEDDINA